jgi:hypothetical protein
MTDFLITDFSVLFIYFVLFVDIVVLRKFMFAFIFKHSSDQSLRITLLLLTWWTSVIPEFYFSFSHPRIVVSHSMEDHSLIMKVCHIVKLITMQREGHFVLGAISQLQVCTCKLITCSVTVIM